MRGCMSPPHCGAGACAGGVPDAWPKDGVRQRRQYVRPSYLFAVFLEKLTSSASRSRDTAKKFLSSEQRKVGRCRRMCAYPPPFCFGPTERSLTTVFREPLTSSRARVSAGVLRARACGKTIYVAMIAMLAFFGHRSQELAEFFKTYSVCPRFLFFPFCERNTDILLGWRAGEFQAQEASHDEKLGARRGHRRTPRTAGLDAGRAQILV